MSDGYQAHDQKELKPYIRMHSLTWLKMNIIQFLLHKFVKIRRKNFIIVSWSGEDCQIKQWWSTDQRDIKEETAWASQGDIPGGGPQDGDVLGVAGEQYSGSCVFMEWEKGKGDEGCIL